MLEDQDQVLAPMEVSWGPDWHAADPRQPLP